MNASLTNVTVVGFGNTQVVYNSVDPVTYDFLTKLRLERLRIDGHYELLGRILVIPLRGKGNCWFDASTYKLQYKFYIIRINKQILFLDYYLRVRKKFVPISTSFLLFLYNDAICSSLMNVKFPQIIYYNNTR